MCSFMLPTAEIETTHSTPSDFSPQMLARGFSSVGITRCPRPWRGRKTTRRSANRPTQYASDGSPNGVRTRCQRTSVIPSSSYSPLPPMIPIVVTASALHRWPSRERQ